ncbi:olfactory receptor 52L1-like [Anguilla anguilla]|uniref:olfactory receptor 52L1-like n=1 Tax=Anguilla anguilla TaxID=7936 RepID=UPI0015AD4079|nr:olfactory receptor 52L1-like [Anguilla anguilla]
MLGHLSSQNYERSLTHCLLQIYCLFLYGIVEFTILTVMSYDRYVAICHPLHYHLLMSPRKKLSCFDTSVDNIVGMALIIVCPGLPIILILFSYAQILRICLFASKESQMKALQTCTPHLVTVMNYSVGVLFELVESSFNMSNIPHKARIFLSLYFLIIPPLLNPVIYGMSIHTIRVQIFKLFLAKEKVNSLNSR